MLDQCTVGSLPSLLEDKVVWKQRTALFPDRDIDVSASSFEGVDCLIETSLHTSSIEGDINATIVGQFEAFCHNVVL